MDDLCELEKILNTTSITTLFQPIFSLTDGAVLGYEALSRGPLNSPLHSPDKLFAAAKKYNRTWELELACRVTALKSSKNIIPGKLLFLNVDPEIIKDEKFQKGLTREYLSKYNISPKNIIFEITERTAISDYKSFSKTLEHYTGQGYKIAIDDTGSGYSGLETISKTKPHYIKLDIELIRNIDKDKFKQSLIKYFVEFAKSTNLKLIAEGIETEGELKILIDLGVYAGQGFFISKPVPCFHELPDSKKNIIVNYNKLKKSHFDIDQNIIGEIAENYSSFDRKVSCDTLKNYFNKTSITGACIVENEIPVGLVMKHTLDSTLATQYGVAIFSKRPASLVMDTNALTVDYGTSVRSTAKIAMERTNDKIYDYVIVTKENKYYGIVTIKNLLEFTIAIEKRQAKELNPLTGLPGNIIIDRILCEVLNSNEEFGILYLDLDNFKVYNDVYGFENGDKILKFTANIIKESLSELFTFENFVGHIGGDDFICIIKASLDECYKLSKLIINKFDNGVLNFFNEIDKQNNYIIALDRKGFKDTFNLTSISIAGIHGKINSFHTSTDLTLYISKLKKKSKLLNHSSYVIEDVPV
ncbi:MULTISPECIES: EAL domain-containing protein [Clostridium]|uniref:EAL domain-containing protein n=1 Tax=Clostridium TaxID=1485 RepID=UPI00082613A9|nr:MULTISPECIES: EAL domain-containing protein [Clostridium]PJI09378.1 histidine kinase [Clostridium sp. CT7]